MHTRTRCTTPCRRVAGGPWFRRAVRSASGRPSPHADTAPSPPPTAPASSRVAWVRRRSCSRITGRRPSTSGPGCPWTPERGSGVEPERDDDFPGLLGVAGDVEGLLDPVGRDHVSDHPGDPRVLCEQLDRLVDLVVEAETAGEGDLLADEGCQVHPDRLVREHPDLRHRPRASYGPERLADRR